ncbi:SDR family NAD(P)-dependent oxidoreductase [Stackebrandtia soli]|uniref:SDR family NAD(P)-dependent oxidoreductase n=1 Tax=Stackebrandtia soli TaxID=1892856 RepID=UPI0039E7960F
MSSATSGRDRRRVVVISGGTNGMGRTLALARARRGDTVVTIGSDRAKGAELMADARSEGLPGKVDFVRADLSAIEGNRDAIAHVTNAHHAVDALVLCANRQNPSRAVTVDGLERTFALYYLSRHLLGHGLTAALSRAPAPVIVNVAGVGMTKGRIHWEDMQLEHDYGMIAAQLQAGRANDLLGVAYAAAHGSTVPYVLYHPGFTRSGDLSPLSTPTRVLLRLAASLFARPVERAVAPMHAFIDTPPERPLTAIDRATSLPLNLATLDPSAAARLAATTEALLAGVT